MTRSAISRCVKIFSLIAIVATFVLGAIGVKPQLASAAAEVSSSQVFSTIASPCGQSVTVEGTLHTVTKSAGGGLVDGRITFSGLKGTGLDGTPYVVTYVQGSSLKLGSTLIQTIDVTYNIIGLGSADNVQLRLRFVLVFNTAGHLTTLSSTVISGC